MSWTAVAHVGAGSGDGNAVTSGAIDTTGANVLFLVLGQENGTLATITDSKSNTWNQLTAFDDAAVKTAIYWSVPSSVGSGHTFTATGVAVNPSVSVGAWIGAAVAPFDQVAGNSTPVGATIATGSLTTTRGDVLLIAAAAGRVGPGAILSIDGSFTIGASVAPTATADSSGIAYLVQTVAGAANPVWTFTGAGSMVASQASFTPAGAHRMFMVF